MALMKCLRRNGILIIIILTLTLNFLRILYLENQDWRTTQGHDMQARFSIESSNNKESITNERLSYLRQKTGEKERTKLKTKTSTDSNHYHSVNFSLNFPVVIPTLTLDQRDNFLVVFVMSAAKGDKHRRRRSTIRNTWGSHASCEQRKMKRNDKLSQLKWQLVFVVGKAGPGTDDDEQNEEEAKKYNDMLIGNMPDNYFNLILKVYMGVLWIGSMPNVKYAIKADDDVYVRIPKVIEYLGNSGFPKRFYGGGSTNFPAVVRNTHGRLSKWAVSREYYPHKFWPKYNSGPCYIISTDLLPHLLNYILVRTPFHIEDVYTGMAMANANVKLTKIKSVTFKYNMYRNMTRFILKANNCQTLKRIVVGHGLETVDNKILHNRIETMCEKHTTPKTCSE